MFSEWNNAIWKNPYILYLYRYIIFRIYTSNDEKWNFGITFSGLLLTGELISFVLFVQKFPFVLVDMILFSFASALGQVRFAKSWKIFAYSTTKKYIFPVFHLSDDRRIWSFDLFDNYDDAEIFHHFSVGDFLPKSTQQSPMDRHFFGFRWHMFG